MVCVSQNKTRDCHSRDKKSSRARALNYDGILVQKEGACSCQSQHAQFLLTQVNVNLLKKINSKEI